MGAIKASMHSSMEKKSKADILAYTDEELVAYFLSSQDDRAISLLYDRYAKPIFGKCFAITGQRELARDFTHDIFIKIFLNLSQFRGDSKFWFWAHRIAYNFCMTSLRKRNRLHFSELNMDIHSQIVDSDEELEAKLDFEVKTELIEAAFLKLSEADRIVLSMKYQSDFSIRQIAETLDQQEGAIKMRLSRGRTRLGELVENLKKSHDE